jgi:hypothetical protein
MLINPKDPMLAAPDPQLELFNRFCREANGFPADLAIGAAANVIVNGLRQSHGSRQEAERRFDELFGRMKSLLVEHYDMLGRKRGVFPYNQVIEMKHFDARRK